MELRHIKYFLTVSEEGSFTKAAEKLLIAQPPLSRQIRDLEEELGTPLFIRKSHGLQLTDAGNRFRQYALQINHLSEQSKEELREMNKGLQGTLFLATVEGIGPYLLSKWIEGFHSKYPHVEYSLWNGNSDDVVNRVNNGLCDLAIITDPYDQEGLEGIHVWKEPWIAMLPKAHPLCMEEGDTIELEKLAPYELIIPSRQSRKQEIEGWFKPLGLEPRVIGRVAHMLNAYELTAQNLGIAIFPHAASRYTSDEVVIKAITHPDVTASYVLVRNSERAPSKVAGEFWNYVKEM